MKVRKIIKKLTLGEITKHDAIHQLARLHDSSGDFDELYLASQWARQLLNEMKADQVKKQLICLSCRSLLENK